MVKVQVSLFATLRQYHPDAQGKKSFIVELPMGATLGQLCKHLGIPEGEVKMTFVNNLRKNLDYLLQDGDQVGIFPPIAGG